MTTDEAIARAQRFFGELPAPKNEANTCDWIVRPLVEAAGYDSHEVHSQLTDGATGRPDYGVVPDTAHTWYVEAKAWSVSLDSNHATQALNYAYANGRRWVVLTNGQEWRLYDAHIQGMSDDRLVAAVRLKDTAAMQGFLHAIGRQSIASGQINEYASAKRLADYLAKALRDPTSPVLQSLARAAQSALSGMRVTPQAVLQALSGKRLSPVGEDFEESAIAPSGGGISKGEGPSDPRNPSPFQGEVGESANRVRGSGFPPPAPGGGGQGEVPGTTSPSNNFFIAAYRGQRATARFNGKGMTILPGSQLTKQPVPLSRAWFERKIKQLLDEGAIREGTEYYEVVRPIETLSPSGASDLVYGHSSNGWTCWHDSNRRTLDEVHRKNSGLKPG